LESAEPEIIRSLLSCDSLNQILQNCDRLFLQHQILIMQGKWEKAYGILYAVYVVRTFLMKAEEEQMLPPYQSDRDTFPEGGNPKFFLREHKLIRKQMDRFVKKMSERVINGKSGSNELVTLFEMYQDFKDLTDHHDARDRLFLFSRLSGTEQAVICKELKQEIIGSDVMGNRL